MFLSNTRNIKVLIITRYIIISSIISVIKIDKRYYSNIKINT